MRSTSVTASKAEVAPGCPTGAWGGDAERKQASIATLRAGLAARPKVLCVVDLFLAPPGSDDFSNVYCAGYGTQDPAELEERSGVPAWVLQLISGVLQACQYRGPDGLQLVASAVDVPQAALEAIPVGADPQSIARRHTVLMLDQCAALRDNTGRSLAPEQQTLVREVRALHAAGSDDGAAFRALRRRATTSADTANEGIEAIVLEFVASVAWPVNGLSAELPAIVSRAHHELRERLAPERPTPEELAALDALSAVQKALYDRQAAEPAIVASALHEQFFATPEYRRVNSPEFQARLEHYMRVGAESYAPLALGMLLEALRSA